MEHDDRIDRAVNFSPELWRACYASVINAFVPHEQSAVARDWWQRVDARFSAMTSGRRILDPAWLDMDRDRIENGNRRRAHQG